MYGMIYHTMLCKICHYNLFQSDAGGFEIIIVLKQKRKVIITHGSVKLIIISKLGLKELLALHVKMLAHCASIQNVKRFTLGHLIQVQ